MLDSKHMVIKLFGKTIPLSTQQQLDKASFAVKSCCSGAAAACTECCDHRNTTASPKNESREELQDKKEEEKREFSAKESTTSNQIPGGDSKDPTSPDTSENPRTLSTVTETSSPQESPASGDQSQTSASQEKTLKKPDKILPCPRCNSMETKFCYYNNYNVNQPRHFCRKCQRYWTAGGTMRNVAVGAGRRKNKSSSALHYRSLMITEALRTAHALAMNGAGSSASPGNNSTVLTFGSDFPLCDSVSSVFNLSENTQNSNRDKHNKSHKRISVSCGGSADNGDDLSSGSSITASNSSDKLGSLEELAKNFQGFPSNATFFPGPPWSYPWNSAMPTPGLSPSGFPVSFYPATTYWGCTVPATWNMPACLSPPSSPLNLCIPTSSPTSPLGKHTRDGTKKYKNNENCILVPKTLRIDDPSETAKSCVWETLRIKSGNSHPVNGVGLFGGFHSKIEGRNCIADGSSVLQTNPAAMSRSLSFREST